MTEDIIGRTAERELMRSISESEEVRCMDGTGTYNLYVFYKDIFPVAMRLEDTPVPIPNTMVKIQAADGTMLETIWESRWLPEPSK